MGLARALWVVEVPATDKPAHVADDHDATDDLASYPHCQQLAHQLRAGGTTELLAPSPTLRPGMGPRPARHGGRMVEGVGRDGQVRVLFGPRPDLVCWQLVERGAPPSRLLEQHAVNPLI